jgi:hypothetical protein
MARDAMDEDEDLVLSTNFPAVGCIMLEFVNALSNHLHWRDIISSAITNYPEFMRTGKTVGGREMKGFTKSDLNLKIQALAHFWGNLLAKLDANPSSIDLAGIIDFMSNFFAAIPSKRYQFFVVKDEQLQPTRRSPLEGTYPYGRTGKTAQDPLPGFMHYKYSKSGQPVVRIIKPGRQTPYVMSPDGSAETPYEETGSKLPRQPNGKYKHIASYSMEELVDLGWDGATYTSTKGRHAARGHHVPFICGYDSDEADTYEPIDLAAGKRNGVIGIPREENGLFMTIPGPQGLQMMQIKNAR